MNYRSCFDIIGPVMIGPSSSHTAGAVLIGKFVHQMLGAQPDQVEITLYESFAQTYQGHGTDKAILGGLINLDLDDVRIKQAKDIVKAYNINVRFRLEDHCPYYDHPNTTLIDAKHKEHRVQVGGASLGGGLVKIFKLNDREVDIRLGADDDLTEICKSLKKTDPS
jgi:iron-sulfur-dependent L-serine dehydratase beta subunit